MGDVLNIQRKLYIGGRDFSGDHTAMALMFGRDPIEFTKGQDDTHKYQSGLKVVSFEAEGVVNLGTDLVEDETFASVDGLSDQPIIVSPTTGLTGEPAYGFRANMGDLYMGGAVGDRFNFKASARAYTSKLVRGKILTDTATAHAVTFSSTARQFAGGVATGKKLYACLQVIAASGAAPTLDGVIQSDTVGFPSPTTVITFAQKTTAGSFEWVELDGPITDDYFRFTGTIGGAGPSFTIVVFLAVL